MPVCSHGQAYECAQEIYWPASAQLNIALMNRAFDASDLRAGKSNPYALKDSGPTSDMTAWTSAGLQPTTGYYPYDPTLAAYGPGLMCPAHAIVYGACIYQYQSASTVVV
uniref:Uncharacterized protein n=1 Tax=Anopheles melas TaxID=34690 RepID=A0A182U082_9DIPT